MSKYEAKPKDGLGARAGTVGAKINAALSGRWQTVDAIAKKTGLPKSTVANRLHRARYRHPNIFKYERVIRFRVIKPKSKKKK
jgi:hypothetical protein